MTTDGHRQGIGRIWNDEKGIGVIMADFWGSMTEGFNKGVPLGVRSYERSKDDERLNRQEKRLDAQDTREGMRLQSNLQEASDRQADRVQRLGLDTETHAKAMAAADLELEEKREKQRVKNVGLGILMAKTLAGAGEERGALAIAKNTYNKNVNNGDEMVLFSREDKPDAVFPDGKKWSDYPEEAKYLVSSRQYGTIPFKSAGDLIKIMEPIASSPEKLLEYERGQRDKVDALNAAADPIRAEDGKLYIKKLTMTRTGTEAKMVPYDGPEPMTAADIAVATLKRHGLDTPENIAVAAGVREKAKAPEMQQKVAGFEATFGRQPSEKEKRLMAGLEKVPESSGKMDDFTKQELLNIRADRGSLKSEILRLRGNPATLDTSKPGKIEKVFSEEQRDRLADLEDELNMLNEREKDLLGGKKATPPPKQVAAPQPGILSENEARKQLTAKGINGADQDKWISTYKQAGKVR